MCSSKYRYLYRPEWSITLFFATRFIISVADTFGNDNEKFDVARNVVNNPLQTHDA